MKSKITVLYLLLFISSIGYSQSDLWTPISKNKIAKRNIQKRDSEPKIYQLYQLNLDQLQAKLARINNRNRTKTKTDSIQFPDSDGNLIAYHVQETATMHPDLAAKYPDIKTYKGTDNNGNSISFSVTVFGLHAMQFSPTGTHYIDPHTTDLSTYIVYHRDQLKISSTRRCFSKHVAKHSEPEPQKRSTATTVTTRLYRIAITSTTEYSSFHIRRVNAQNKSDAIKKGVVLAAMNVTLTRVNAIYNRELAITMQLVADNDKLIFIDSDNYINDDSDQLLVSSQSTINSIIGYSNYDIGHLVSTGGGGVAFIESVCTNDKAKGVTGSSSPVGDPYDIDFVAHEIGHQFGAYHTFNNSCSGNISRETAYEPGSGSTIMGYAGVCPTEVTSESTNYNIQKNSDDYFHAITLQQINSFVSKVATCAKSTISNNTPPSVEAGSNYIIPHSTPFKLTGSATDTDTNLTYCWEQWDIGQVSGKPTSTRTTAANFRSLLPTTSPVRYFPKHESVLTNKNDDWEVLPSVARNMNFMLTVRDNNNTEGGATGQDQTTVTTIAKGPFNITSQAAANTCLVQDIAYRISWNVAGTTANGINTTAVNIKLSKDNGQTFDIVLANDTPNDGEESVVMPQIFCDACRILIEPTNSIYYAVNEQPFSIGRDESCLVTDFVLFQEKVNTIEFKYKPVTQNPIEIFIYDSIGRLIITETYATSPFLDKGISSEALQNGVYIFKLKESGITFTKKIIVSNKNL